MTCEDCLYYEPCSVMNAEFKKYPKDFVETDLCAKQCTTFKGRARFVELPCKLGDFVYFIKARRVMADIVSKFTIDRRGVMLQRVNGYNLGYTDQLGKKIFLTHEEAEKALKEREENV